VPTKASVTRARLAAAFCARAARLLFRGLTVLAVLVAPVVAIMARPANAQPSPGAAPTASSQTVDVNVRGAVTIASASAQPKKPMEVPGTCSLSDYNWKSIAKLDSLVVVYATITDSGDETSDSPQLEIERAQGSPADVQCSKKGSLAHPVICFPAASGGERTTSYRPNRPLTVWVIHAGGDNVASVTAAPAQGATAPAILQANGRATSFLPGAPPTPPPKLCVTTRFTLAPRAPGALTITTSLQSRDGTALAGTALAGTARAIELVLETEYVGAIRIGAGLAFPNGGVHSWSARAAADGGTAIYEDSYSPIAFELVAGYSWFCPLLCDRPTTLTLSQPHWGWFNGLGLASASPASANVTVFSAVYSGIELSLGGLALELLMGIHRDTVLGSGFVVGSHLPMGAAIPMATAFHASPAIVLSMSSDVFKIAGATVP
jgi:hypothetical protein